MSAAGDEECELLENDFVVDSIYAGPLIKVVVGSLAQVFFVHHSHLTEASPFFRACLSSGMVEQQRDEIILPEDPSRAFKFLVEWMYERKVPKIEDDQGAMSAVQAWALADKYCMPDLQNSLMDSLRDFWAREYMHPQFLSWVVKNTKTTAPLQEFVYQQLAYDLVNAGFRYGSTPSSGDADSSSTTAFRDLLANPEISVKLFWLTIDLNRKSPSPSQPGGCNYHVDTETHTHAKKEDGTKEVDRKDVGV